MYTLCVRRARYGRGRARDGRRNVIPQFLTVKRNTHCRTDVHSHRRTVVTRAARTHRTMCMIKRRRMVDVTEKHGNCSSVFIASRHWFVSRGAGSGGGTVNQTRRGGPYSVCTRRPPLGPGRARCPSEACARVTRARDVSSNRKPRVRFVFRGNRKQNERDRVPCTSPRRLHWGQGIYSNAEFEKQYIYICNNPYDV